MTIISVDTGPLRAAASRAQALRRGAGQRAQAVTSVLPGLDLQFSARQHFDQRLRVLSTRLGRQAESLGEQGHFLAFAAARYENAEAANQERAPRDQLRGAGEARVGAFGAFCPVEGVRPAPFNDLIRLSAAELLGADADVQEAWVDLVGAVPLLGTMLAVDEIVAELENDRPEGTTLDLLKMIGGEAVEKGFGIPGLATLIGLLESAAHLSQSDQLHYGIMNGTLPDWVPYVPILDMSQELQWATDHIGGVVTAVSDVAAGVVSAFDRADGRGWDWVTPW
jgi:hypothetical protein